MSVSVRGLLEDAELREWLTLHIQEADLSRRIQHPRVQKSGLVLAGHAQGVVPSRVQVLGETEISYLESLPEALQDERAAFMFSLGLSLVVITRGVAPHPALLRHATASQTPLVGCPLRSSSTINLLHSVLDRVLAPSTRMHGVLVEVHGVGMLLLGPSGIGKSECALFLVERGHRLVADDQVQLTRLPDGSIRGTPLPLLRHHLEIRGLGILNIRDLFGATAVREESAVDMVVELCAWREDETYERLGLDDQSVELLESPISKLRIPVRPGRDMAVILEISARNHLLKREGVHGARRFAERLERALVTRDD
jgi:HPr kinase/phosphorylase